ncbi:excinuclease ABC, C subunit [gamma proteobacterium HTCC5015]|nr:excinuclease ABC, C subunit [gamma proteobacterium HTCC5015]
MTFDAKPFLAQTSTRPGVYRMYNAEDELLYVGKAKSLKRRLSSYFRNSALAVKTQALVAQIEHIEVTITQTEAEALILESHLIKRHKPRYNILLKDDKSYPLIRISQDAFPRISYYRGRRDRKDAEYFGPYPSSGAVKHTLDLLQKLFRIRQCEDSYYKNRSRPCLQYQIKRCTAPCVGYVSEEDYARDLENTRRFLSGKSVEVIDDLVARMDSASQNLEFEKAALYRDQIRDVQQVVDTQGVQSNSGNADAVALCSEGGVYCVSIHSVRGGHSLGAKSYFPKIPKGEQGESVLMAFMAQHYLSHDAPQEIVASLDAAEAELLSEALTLHSDHRVKIIRRPRSDKAAWLRLAQTNAQHALAAKLASREGMGRRLAALQQLIGIDQPPQRMECFDISHTGGERTVASCVVFDAQGARKDLYRRFNIDGIEPGDDYAAMHQALKRRYSKVQRESGRFPDLLFIDGGKGQVAEAKAVLDELGITEMIIVGVSKGPERRAGEEQIVLPHQERLFRVDAANAGLHLIQQIRDEAHRFAITGHRARRGKARKTSVLEGIPGVGAKRRQQLIKHFGGIQGIMRAGVDDIARVPGISRSTAEAVYEAINPNA